MTCIWTEGEGNNAENWQLVWTWHYQCYQCHKEEAVPCKKAKKKKHKTKKKPLLLFSLHHGSLTHCSALRELKYEWTPDALWQNECVPVAKPQKLCSSLHAPTWEIKSQSYLHARTRSKSCSHVNGILKTAFPCSSWSWTTPIFFFTLERS